VTKELTTGFDYESVDKETAGKLAYYAERGHKLLKASQVRFIAEMGQLLSEAQTELANHHNGTFVKWATTEFDISKQTLYNYVHAWDRMLSNGWTTYQNLSPTAIYLLTAEEPAKPLLKKVEYLAAQNEPVRRADVQRLIDASKPKPKAENVTLLHSDKPKPPSKPATASDSKPEKVQFAPFEKPKPPSKPAEQAAESTEQESAVDAYQAASEESQGEADARADAEPVNSLPPWKIQRAKAKKTAEALMRALQDLNDMRPITFVRSSVDDCLAIISELEAMR
jgi:hypothetical protein